jgi:hypothetical protein
MRNPRRLVQCWRRRFDAHASWTSTADTRAGDVGESWQRAFEEQCCLKLIKLGRGEVN